MAEKKKKLTKTQQIAKKKKRDTTSKDLPPGKVRSTGKKIEARRKLLQSI